MDEKQQEVYNILNNIRVLTFKNYNKLISDYGETLVNFVIEKMIDESAEKAEKFDYYINKIISCDNSAITKDIFDAYILDVTSLTSYTSEENSLIAREIHKIVNEINNLLNSVDYEEVDSVWITDRVEYYISTCTDLGKLKKIKKLYNEFLYKRNLLIEGNLKLVISFAKQFYRKGIDFNDLVQYGNLGLMRAIEKYDPTYNTSLATYAYHWIKQSITRNMTLLTCPVVVPYGFITLNMSIVKAIKDLTNKNGIVPNDNEIAEYLGLPVEKVEEVRLLFSESLSLNQSISDSSDSLENSSFIDLLEDKTSNVEEQIFNSYFHKEFMDLLKNELTDKEYDILCYRYGLNGYSCKTLNSIGKMYGVSRERIRQIEKKVISYKLKRKCENFRIYL